jgi:hypothetical protein
MADSTTATTNSGADTIGTGTDVSSAALRIAAAGLPVFPCAKSNKRPCTPHGFKDASTDPAVIEKLWREHPGELIGVPTGDASGLDALDLDPRHQQAKDWWSDNLHRIPRTRTHKTRSGGLHLLFQHDDRVRCGAGRIALGVDTRADGGYVIWWPATGLPVRDAPTAPWPHWLIAALQPKSRPISAKPPIRIPDHRALAGIIRAVAGAAEGTRNAVLFWAGCRAGEMVASGLIAVNTAVAILTEAALRAGLPRKAAEDTALRGIERGRTDV